MAKLSTLLIQILNNLPWLVLLSIGLFDLGRGGFHWLAPDSGAHSVAGMNLNYANSEDVIFLLASIGLMQVLLGTWYFYFAIWHRSLIPFALLTEVIKNTLELFTEYTFKHPVSPVPGRFAHWAVLTIAVITLITSVVPSATFFFAQKRRNIP